MTALSDIAASLAADLASAPAARMLIHGEQVAAVSGKAFVTENPSDGTKLTRVADGDVVDVNAAVASARRAFNETYNRFSPAQREKSLARLADLIESNYGELRMLDALEMGQPLGAELVADGAADVLRYFAGWCTKICGETVPNSLVTPTMTMTLREPVGVVGAIIPWNGPLLAVMWKLGPALASGCTVVLKPAEDANLCALRIGQLVLDAGFPPGTVNVVTGGGSTAGAALASHLDVDKISFTGSTATGRRIMAGATSNMKRLTMEMGGKAAHILFSDADLSRAVPAAAIGAFGNTGQMCCAGSRIFVERPIYEEVIAGMAAFTDHLTVGPSTLPNTVIGPLASRRQRDKVREYLAIGRREGARVINEERAPLDVGCFVAPTILADVDDGMRVAQEEIFGPVASVLPFDSEAEVIRRANSTVYGLGGGVWTSDLGKALRVTRALRTGTVWVNTYLAFDPAMPFGGYKMSGWGSDLGRAAVDGHLTTKAVWIDTR